MHPLYNIWRNIKRRTGSEYATNYKNYGGRGIKLCDEWKHDFLEFAMYMVTLGWRKGLEIDRIDNDGDYTVGNVRIVSRIQNMRNSGSRLNVTSKYKGVSYDKNKGGWVVRIKNRNANKYEYLGLYDDEEEAAIVYNKRASELFGEYAYLNKV